MSAHSACSKWISCWSDCIAVWLWQMRLSNSSQRCSIGFKSSNLDDPGRKLMLFIYKNPVLIRSVCSMVLSLWKVLSFSCMKRSVVAEFRLNNAEPSDYHWRVLSWSFKYAAVIWLEYCRYGIKPKTINQSINQSF